MSELFALQVPAWELILRGSAMYWLIFLLLRMVLRRDLGSIGPADMLLLVLIADAAQNGMAGDYRTITEGGVLVGTLIGWSWLIDGASYRWPAARRLLEPASLVLIHNGRVRTANLAREWITTEELAAKLREHGVERPAQVKMARLESDGQITVVPFPPARDSAHFAHAQRGDPAGPSSS